jgi:hypothetical protein
MTQIVWTQALATAAANIAADTTTIEYRESLLRDIRSRAREFAAQRVGAPMTAQQVEYVNLLRSRLADYALSQLPSRQLFNLAWAQAYDAANS